MCGRYSIFTPTADVERRFEAEARRSFEPTYNAAPGQRLPVVVEEGGQRQIVAARWGFVPGWADRDLGTDLINARAETVTEKPAFREAFRSRRCLVPADGFYEWPDGGDGPHRVVHEDGLFGMAGVYSEWTPPVTDPELGDFADGPVAGEADPVGTFAVITTEPNAVVAPLHDRMAAVLDADRDLAWLDASTETAAAMLGPAPAEAVDAYRVSGALNDPANDRPELVEPVEGA